MKVQIDQLYTGETQGKIRLCAQNIVEFNRVPHFAKAMREDMGGNKVDFMAMLRKPGSVAEENARIEAVTEFCALVTAARGGSEDAKTELNELQRIMVDIFVRADSPIASLFFEQNNLRNDQQAAITYTFNQEVTVKYIGEDGGPRSVKLTKAQQHDYIRMRRLWSAAMEYPLEDINTGVDVAGLAQATVDCASDIAAQINALAFTLLKTRFGTFNAKSGQINKTYLLHSRAVPGNLPTTNAITSAVGSGETAGKVRLTNFKDVLKYYTAWGSLFKGLGASGIVLVPSTDAAGLTDQFVPTGTFHNKVADSVLSNYLSFTYFKDWTIVPDVTLDPAEGFMYPVPTMPIGRVHMKVGMDKEIVKTDDRNNLEERSQSKVIAFDAPEPYRPRICRIKYGA